MTRLFQSCAGAVILCGALFVISSCATAPKPMAAMELSAALSAAGEAPGVIERVPFLPQEGDSCGPSALAMLLRHRGLDGHPADIAEEAKTAGLKDVLITDLANAARRRGVAADVVSLDYKGLRDEIAAGRPVIVLLDLGGGNRSVPHFVLAYGYTKQGVVAHSASSSGKTFPFPEFEESWSRMNRLAIVVRS